MPLILGTNSIKDTGYDVANSVRLEAAYMKRTVTPSTSNTWTLSFWLKKSGHNGSSEGYLFSYGADGGQGFYISAAGYLGYYGASGYSSDSTLSQGVLRDVSSWSHICFSVSSGTGTLYINGVQDATISNVAPLNATTGNTYAVNSYINYEANFDNFLGYMAEYVFIDGTAYDQNSFGEFDSDSPNIWKPIDVSELTFGTNGFYLDFEDSSDLGKDVSGNSNHFTTTGLTATDQATDTCTNNFATLNSLLDVNATPTFSEGNLVFQGTGSTNFVGATIPVSSGKWYVEVKATTVNGSYPIIGVIDSQSYKRRDSTYFVGSDIDTSNPSGFAVFSNGDIYHNADNNFSNLTTTYTSGDIIGMALNMDASPNTLGFYKNGALEVTINLDTAPSGAYMFSSAIHSSTSSAKGEFNFGNPTFSISSGNTDANGYGNFEYSVPSGYFALCTKNLAEYG